jgi:hypothetical protein
MGSFKEPTLKIYIFNISRRALGRQTTETKEPKLKISGALSGAGAKIFVE